MHCRAHKLTFKNNFALIITMPFIVNNTKLCAPTLLPFLFFCNLSKYTALVSVLLWKILVGSLCFFLIFRAWENIA